MSAAPSHRKYHSIPNGRIISPFSFRWCMKSFHTPVPPDGRLSTADAPVLAIDSVDAEPTMMRPCRQYASWGGETRRGNGELAGRDL